MALKDGGEFDPTDPDDVAGMVEFMHSIPRYDGRPDADIRERIGNVLHQLEWASPVEIAAGIFDFTEPQDAFIDARLKAPRIIRALVDYGMDVPDGVKTRGEVACFLLTLPRDLELPRRLVSEPLYQENEDLIEKSIKRSRRGRRRT